jgi:hypothetical protein
MLLELALDCILGNSSGFPMPWYVKMLRVSVCGVSKWARRGAPTINRTHFDIVSHLFVCLISTKFIIYQGTAWRLLMNDISAVENRHSCELRSPNLASTREENGPEHPDGIPAIPVGELSPLTSYVLL